MTEADTVVTAVMGSVGLRPTLAAIQGKKRIALANKETLVCAGTLVMDAAEKYSAEIVPVDSEHSAVFQCLQGCRDRGEVRRILLTCSGGPFYGRTFDELEHMTAADALRHPNWHMGPKITVDSATLMNKGLEIIEAMRLYRLPVEQVEAVIHRQSIVHSLVEYRDGAMIAQLGTADMKLPIRYALTYPYRAESPDKPLDLLTCGALTFAEPDERAFPVCVWHGMPRRWAAPPAPYSTAPTRRPWDCFCEARSALTISPGGWSARWSGCRCNISQALRIYWKQTRRRGAPPCDIRKRSLHT